MKFNNFGYLIKEGFRGIFRHGFMSFAAVCVTMACLLLVGSFSSVIINLNGIVNELNETNVIMAYVDETKTDDQAKSVGTQINRIENVQKAEFMSREEALANFAADYDPAVFEGTDPKTFQHRFVLELKNNHLINETVEELLTIEGVEDVEALDEVAEGFATAQDILRFFSVLFIIILLAVSLLIISNTVKLAMYDRKEEISIMKMVGATNGFIRLPFVVEGFALGLFSAMLSFFLMWLMYNGIVNRINAVDALGLFEFVPFTQLLVPMVATFVTAGVFVGVVGSWTSIRKFMDV